MRAAPVRAASSAAPRGMLVSTPKKGNGSPPCWPSGRRGLGQGKHGRAEGGARLRRGFGVAEVRRRDDDTLAGVQARLDAIEPLNVHRLEQLLRRRVLQPNEVDIIAGNVAEGLARRGPHR